MSPIPSSLNTRRIKWLPTLPVAPVTRIFLITLCLLARSFSAPSLSFQTKSQMKMQEYYRRLCVAHCNSYSTSRQRSSTLVARPSAPVLPLQHFKLLEGESMNQASRIVLAIAICFSTTIGATAQATPGRVLLALSKHDHTLAIVDPETLKVIARAPVGPDPTKSLHPPMEKQPTSPSMEVVATMRFPLSTSSGKRRCPTSIPAP